MAPSRMQIVSTGLFCACALADIAPLNYSLSLHHIRIVIDGRITDHSGSNRTQFCWINNPISDLPFLLSILIWRSLVYISSSKNITLHCKLLELKRVKKGYLVSMWIGTAVGATLASVVGAEIDREGILEEDDEWGANMRGRGRGKKGPSFLRPALANPSFFSTGLGLHFTLEMEWNELFFRCIWSEISGKTRRQSVFVVATLLCQDL